MVLSLIELSLRSITKGIENGTIRHPHLLPPKLRQRVLDTALKQGLSNNLKVLSVLTSVEFLNGMTSISAKSCNDNDLRFLEHLAASLATKLPNGQTVGAAITKLNLKFLKRNGVYVSSSSLKDFSTVHGLISECPNTRSLDLHVTNKDGSITEGYWPLYENSVWIRFMENLVELSLCCWTHVGNIGRPVIKFGQLTTLKLDHCSLADDQWAELLKNIPFLENLRLIGFQNDAYWKEKRLDSILPFSLPHLKSLELKMFFKCNNAFVDNLMGCRKLRQAHLILDQKSTNEESLVRLANIGIDLKIKIRVVVRGYDTAMFDSSSHFRLVRIFHERMDSFELFAPIKWEPQISASLEDVVDTCSNLTKFGISLPQKDSNPIRSEVESEDMKRVNAALVQFFGPSKLGLKLNDLRLAGNFDEAVMSAIFENCLNLTLLHISNCQSLCDRHLIDWVSRGGGNLTDLVMSECKNVTSEGIIPILARSGERLYRCYCIDLGQDKGGRHWKTNLRNHCPNANAGFANYP